MRAFYTRVRLVSRLLTRICQHRHESPGPSLKSTRPAPVPLVWAVSTAYSSLMDTETTRLIAIGFACIGLVSTVVYYVFRYKELKVLREIRDRVSKSS